MLNALRDRLPPVRGKLRPQASLATWFQTGGKAEWLFRPEDDDDLAEFMRRNAQPLPVTVLGAGSNVLVRDGGIAGVVVRLGGGFAALQAEGDTLIAGAGCLNIHAAEFARDHGIGGLEFLSGIPGSIGGALAMNAGAYGQETEQVLIQATLMDKTGATHEMQAASLGYRYRGCELPEGGIFLRARLQGVKRPSSDIAARMETIREARASSQPVRARTGGSTFKNPPGHKAWQLIDAAGCRGLTQGAAQVSKLHCNFLVNTGGASAAELEALGETVRERVAAKAGITLEWEIKRMGEHRGNA